MEATEIEGRRHAVPFIIVESTELSITGNPQPRCSNCLLYARCRCLAAV